jgi:thiamine biosynthesis lipoprotein ApbE
VEYTKYTKGYFNLFVGELTNFWDICFKKASEIYTDQDFEKFKEIEPHFSLESKTNLENIVKAIPKTNEEIDKVLVFNDETKEVIFNSLKDENNNSLGKISISTGGVAKGYATDILKEKLNEAGYKDGYLFSGGSSILSLGEPIYNNSKGVIP